MRAHLYADLLAVLLKLKRMIFFSIVMSLFSLDNDVNPFMFKSKAGLFYYAH